MTEKFRLSLLTPQSRLFDGVVDGVTAPGHQGDFGVLPGHVAYITAIRPGPITWEADGKRQLWSVGAGFAQVSAERVSVVVSSAEAADAIDVAAAKEALARAERALMEATPGDSAWIDANVDQAMAQGRLLAAERARG